MTRTETIFIRLTPEEHAMVKRAASADGQTVSEYVRACIITVRGIEGDPVAWGVIRKNVQAAITELLPPVRRKKLA